MKTVFFLFLFVFSTAVSSTVPAAEQATGPGGYDRPLDLETCGIYYRKYEPSFYTGFAPRSRDPKRLHLHVGRGNQLRATLVLSGTVLEAYVRDLLARYSTYRTMIDEGSLTLTQNTDFEDFEKVIRENEIAKLAAAEPEMAREDIVRRNLLLMARLNPGRIFHISTPVDAVIQHWLDFLEPADFGKIDRKRQLVIVNEMLPTRLWLTSLDRETARLLDELIQRAAKSSRDPTTFTASYLTLLDRVSGGIYPVKNNRFDFAEFTAIYPIGTFNGYTTCRGNRKIPLYPTPGKWTLTTHQRTKTVDHIPEAVIYSYFPWIPYMHVGKKLHNSFHTLWWKMEYVKTSFLPEALQKPQIKSREGKNYRYLWLLSRGPMSHGCTHVNGGHILELRQLLPVDVKKIYEVVFFINKSCLFDVFDIDGDLAPEVMGVRYYIAYTLKDKKPGRLRAPMQRRAYYKWLYGGILKYDTDGRGYFENIRDGRFIDKLAVNGREYKKRFLYEAELEPFRLQFFKMKDIPSVRELRKVGADFPKPISSRSANEAEVNEERFFTLQNGTNLRSFGGPEVRQLLFRKRGGGAAFGAPQEKLYCRLKNSGQVQWALTDLQTGTIVSRSKNAGEVFFGASASKIFVAAALLDKQNGQLSRKQLLLMTRMIVRSDNHAWKELQRQAGTDGSDDSGRRAVHAFVQKMGYKNTRAFQGWMKRPDGTRLHGNELNALAVSQFLYDTYHNRYPGAEILWKIMHATRTGSKKINRYTPRSIYMAGKTGTYHGPNESRTTIEHAVIRAHNHVTVFDINGKYYSLTILSNTGRDEDVAVLGGGLMREYLGVDRPVTCQAANK